ncbi:hypothetical protein [Paraburkholderia xenovorans]|uniref:hypothetical protein n=1 Tax=Paraburkholderia xenovorans TaxID=36873 RepID=UPI0038BCB758
MVSDIGFRSRFAYEKGNEKQLISELIDPACETEEYKQPLSALTFSTLEERDEFATRHLQVRLGRYTRASEAVLNRFEDFRDLIRRLKARPPPSALTKKNINTLIKRRGFPSEATLEKLTDTEWFQVVFYIVERDEVYKTDFRRPVSLRRTTEMIGLASIATSEYLFTVLISNYFLPRLVVMACYVALLARLGCNSQTLISVTLNDVQQNLDGTYTITGLKSRSDQIIESTVNEEVSDEEQTESNHEPTVTGDSLACRALELLIWNSRQIDKFGYRTSDSLFCTQNLERKDKYTFDIPRIKVALRDFCLHEQLPVVIASAFRDQYANLEYLRTGKDVGAVAAVLQHQSIDTTLRYLSTRIVQMLGEANMKRYMDKLAPSIVFACGGDSEVERLGFSPDLVSRQLLFPPSHLEMPADTDTLANKWLNASGEIRFCITENEIKHCAYQMQFYRKNLRRLASSDEYRFRKFHLPAILFCRALYLVILASKHQSVLTDFEETLSEG